MTHPICRRAGAVAAVAGIGFAVMLAFAPAGANASTACSQVREKQMLRIPVTWRYRNVLSRVDQGILRTQVLSDQRKVFARLVIAGATCKRPGAGWVVIRPVALGYSSVGVNAVGKITSSGLLKGWGIGVRGGAGAANPRISLQVMHCGQGNFFKTLKVLTSVPLPSMGLSVALWLTGQFLPADKVRCGNVGVKRLLVHSTSTGRLRVGDLSSSTCCTESVFNQSHNGGWNSSLSYEVGRIAGTAS